MRFAIWQGLTEGVLVIHRIVVADRWAAIVDVEGSIKELVMLLCCEDEKGGFAGLTEGRKQFYCHRSIS